MSAVTAILVRAAKLAGMTSLAASRQALLRPAGGASCSVCWQEFENPGELDHHIRCQHPERLLEPSELSRRARLRWVEGGPRRSAAPSRRD